MNEIKNTEYASPVRTLWIFGLSGSGKSTLANEAAQQFKKKELRIALLDGDVLRTGINSNLGFSPKDRHENLRRAAWVAKILNDAGVSVIASFITPYQSDREMIAGIIGRDKIKSVYLSTSVAVCESRDPRGLYKKARSGEIKEFTGITAPFESPESADLTIDTAKFSIQQGVTQLVKLFN